MWFGGSAERRGFLLFFFEVIVFILIVEYLLKSAISAALLGFSRSSTDLIIFECIATKKSASNERLLLFGDSAIDGLFSEGATSASIVFAGEHAVAGFLLSVIAPAALEQT